MTDPGREKYSESTLRLAERYGIDPARLDAMLGKPAESFAADIDQHIHQPNVDTAPRRPSVKIVEPNSSTAPASGNINAAKDIRAEGSSLAGSSRQSKTYTYEKQVSPATWIVALLVLGALAAMFFISRGCNKETAERPMPGATSVIDTVVKTDTVATIDTVVTTVPAETTPPVRRTTARRASSSRNVALTTTSSFSAQERAAELRAEGNPNANIRKVQRNGVTVYEVRTKK